jgi:hypothetical protein
LLYYSFYSLATPSPHQGVLAFALTPAKSIA